MHSKKLKRLSNKLYTYYYRHFYTYWRPLCLRRKKSIRVAFALTELSQWKSESLYNEMLKHPRFNPILVIIRSNRHDHTDELRSYFKTKNYDYADLSAEQTICEALHPDIILYPEPYDDIYVENHMYHHNLKALFCLVIYSLRSSTESWAVNAPLIFFCWQVYYENTENLNTYRRLNANRAKNGIATGLPIQDELLSPVEEFDDPWKPSNNKKRIIYAPHHSINPENWMHLSTFLSTGKIMLELAEKYADSVQWLFKPHPLLRSKLEKYWGKDATDRYYESWEQIATGKYLDFFKHSDAMIHDCGSFTMEYLAMNRPVMYLMTNQDVAKDCNEMHKRALGVHYQGITRDDIEQFICNVIKGDDPLKARREEYRRQYLTPPGGQSACTNIINAILGK